jgi:hypothetical protein
MIKDKVLQRGDRKLGRTHKNNPQINPPDTRILTPKVFSNNPPF